MRDMTQPRLLGGRYELDGVVGRGGMAEVYRARDIRLDRIVAIKTLRADLARDQIFQARFRREAQSAASLNHPSIVAVYDTGEDTRDGVVSITWIIVAKTSNPRIKQMTKKMIQCERFICGIGVRRGGGLSVPERDGSSANLVFVSIVSVRVP